MLISQLVSDLYLTRNSPIEIQNLFYKGVLAKTAAKKKLHKKNKHKTSYSIQTSMTSKHHRQRSSKRTCAFSAQVLFNSSFEVLHTCQIIQFQITLKFTPGRRCKCFKGTFTKNSPHPRNDVHNLPLRSEITPCGDFRSQEGTKVRRQITKNGLIEKAIPVFQSTIVQRRPTDSLVQGAMMSTKT